MELLDHTDTSVAKKILDLCLASYAVEAQLIGCEDFPPLRTTQSQLQHSGGQFFGVFQASELLGVVHIEHQATHTDVHRLVVSPTSFRQGVGRRLMLEVQKQASALRLSTAKLNKPAINLYEKLGFTVVNTWQDQATNIELVAMRWSR